MFIYTERKSTPLRHLFLMVLKFYIFGVGWSERSNDFFAFIFVVSRCKYTLSLNIEKFGDFDSSVSLLSLSIQQSQFPYILVLNKIVGTHLIK